MPVEKSVAPQQYPAELYNSRIIQSWLEYLAEAQPGLDLIQLLDAAGIKANQADDPKQWFTQEQIDRFHAYIDEQTNDPAISRQAGRFVVFKKRPNVLQQYAFGFFDPMTAYLGLPKIMPRVTRGSDVHAQKLTANRVEITNVPANGAEEKSFQCENRIGIYEAMGRLFTHHFSKVEHPECWHKGGRVCRYVVSWPNMSHLRWRKGRNGLTLLAVLVCAGLGLGGASKAALVAAVGAAFGAVLLNCMANRSEKNNMSAALEQQGNAARRLFSEIGIRHNTAVLIQEIGSLSSKTTRVDQVLHTVAHAIQKRLAMDRVMLIYDGSGGRQDPDIVNCGYGESEAAFLIEAWQKRRQYPEQPLQPLFKEWESVIINTDSDPQSSTAPAQLEFMQSIGASAFMGIPIVFEERLVGIMVADFIRPKREVSTMDVRLLKGIALQMAVQANAVIAYDKLQKSEAQYRLMADHVSDVIWMLDAGSMRFTFVSPSVERLMGYTAEEMLALSLEDILTADALTLATETIVEELEKDNNPEADPFRDRAVVLEQIRKDGSHVWVEVTARFIRDDTGKAIQILGVSRNVSERVESEKAQDLLRQQLGRAQKMEALGTLAGGVAHDLNNILSGLVSYPDLLLLELPKDSPLRQPVNTILRSGQRAAAIVQDLLTLARRGVIVTKAVNLNHIVNEYLGSHEFGELSAFHPKCTISQNLEKELPAVEGSPVHLSKTVMNLVGNAMEAMPEGGAVHIVTTHREVETAIDGYERIAPGAYVVLQVKDVGVGIEMRDLQHIFEPFYTKKIMGRSGTGLGMAVVWGTVKDANGYIDVDTEIGRGTTFSLYFPVALKPIEKEPGAISMDAYVGDGETILVVDDVAEQRDVAAAILTELGYRVNTVDSGEAAEAYVQRHKVDLVVLDMIMEPGMDGLDTYRRILACHPSQRAIIATGYSETDRVAEVRRLGAATCIKKPYTIEAIGIAVRKALNGR